MVPSTWLEEHDVEVEETSTAPLGSAEPGGDEAGPAAVDDGGPTAAPTTPLHRVLDRFDLLDHPAGRAAVREQQRAGGRLDVASLRELLATGDVPRGTRRLCVREYSQLVSHGGGGPVGAGGRAPDRGESGGGELVEAVRALGELDRLRSDESDTEEIAEVVASAVGETLGPTLRAVASAVDGDEEDGRVREEVRELREQLREEREARREEQIKELEERVKKAEASGGSDLPADADVAELAVADRTAERIASRLPEGERLLEEIRGIVEELAYQPGAGLGTPRAWWDEAPPEQFQEQQQAGGIERLDPEEAAEGAGRSRGQPDDDVAELWESLGGGRVEYECRVCETAFVHDGAGTPSCPECGDGAPKPVSDPGRGFE